jgi:hypothetical protein
MNWEQEIPRAFIRRYFASLGREERAAGKQPSPAGERPADPAGARPPEQPAALSEERPPEQPAGERPADPAEERPPASPEGRNTLRLRSAVLFPGFRTAAPDEKEAYLEAAEALEKRGLIELRWEKRGRGEQLKTLFCPDMEKLIAGTGTGDPRGEARLIRELLAGGAASLESPPEGPGGPEPGALPGEPGQKPDEAKPENPAEETAAAFLKGLSERFSFRELERGIGRSAMEDLLKLLLQFRGPRRAAAPSVRALSVQLFRDSKRLEYIYGLLEHFNFSPRNLGLPERSFPETLVSGPLAFEYREGGGLENPRSLILGLPLESAEAFRSVRTLSPKEQPGVLVVENKESFYALARRAALFPAPYDCCLYCGGYPNRAAAAMIRLFAAAAFRFFHAGDLDPDGLLIFQTVADIAGRPLTPLRMDGASFDRYLPWARPLKPSMLAQLDKLRPELAGEFAGLIRRIRETGCGVEQEIIDYR